MHDVRTFFAPDRYSARRMLKPVNFICRAPGAARVYLVGDFNNWDPGSHPMERQPDGAWRIQVQLHHGHHQYLFLVDGQPALDPRAQGVVRNPEGQQSSLMSVS